STPRTACPTCSTWWCAPTRSSPRPGSTRPRPNAGGASGLPSPSCPGQRPCERQPSAALPGSLLAHLGVVLGQVALHPADVGLRQVGAAPRALHDLGRGHHATRHGLDRPVDHIGDEQLVAGKVVLAAAVVPDVGVAVLLVRLILGPGPPADPLLGLGSVPLAVAVGERVILERGDGHIGRLPSSCWQGGVPYPPEQWITRAAPRPAWPHLILDTP